MLTKEVKDEIEVLWKARPAGMTYPPASEHELSDFEAKHQTIPDDFRWFLSQCGSGVVGSEWLDGIDDLFASHQKFHEECTMADGWCVKEMFLIGWDGIAIRHSPEW